MPVGHVSRGLIAMARDGDVGALEDDDPDRDIEALPDISPMRGRLQDLRDDYRNLTVLRWAEEFENGVHYTYAAIKIENIGWFITGQYTDPLPWDELWNRHLRKALWSESAATWTTLKL